MEIKAVLFDMDGVLVDSETYYMEGTYNWMKELGFQGTYRDVCQIIGTTMEVTYQMIEKMMNGQYTIEQLTKVNEQYFLVDHPMQYRQIMNPDLMDLLNEIKARGYRCAVCSSSPKETIDQALRECGITFYFDYVVSGEQFTQSKPHPEIYLHAADMLDVEVEQCLVIEDSSMGIEAGKNAKMKTIGILDRRFGLRQSHADVLVERLSEVLECVKYL